MNKPHKTLSACAAAAVTALALAMPWAAHAQNPQSDLADQMAIARQERADCLAGRSPQPREVCLYENRSVMRDLRQGKSLSNDDSSTLASSTQTRCDGLPSDARDSCQRQQREQGQR